MTNWSDGYVSDISYTTGFYRETSPAWLSLATSLLGHRPPGRDGSFRWCELGCGQGFSALSFAAAHPTGEFYAFDFNPSHIENARLLASRAGIGNITFGETSFEELAEAPKGTYPQMDYIVLHGIWSWVSTTQRAHILRFIANHLAPGGIVYVSYNVLTGWASMVPMQRLMRAWCATQPGGTIEHAAGVLAFLKQVTATESLYFPANPSATARLDQIVSQDARYLAHEYLNETWDPIMFDAMARDMGESKCSYIGSATLTDNIDAVSVPAKVAAMAAGITDPRLRELVRDVGGARPFRRDLFRRGAETPPPGEQVNIVDQIVMTGLGRERDANIQIQTGIGHVTPKPEIYAPVLQRLLEGPLAFAELRRMPMLADKPLAEALQVLAFLAAGGMAHPTANLRMTRDGAAPSAALNRQIGVLNAQGSNLPYLVSPRLGTAITVDPVDTMVLQEFVNGPVNDLAPVATKMIATLALTGRAPVREGKPISEPVAAQAAMLETIEKFVAERVPLLQRLGILDT